MKKWTRVMYQPNRPLKEGCYVTASKEHIALSREAAAEGMVLLKNEHKLLPLKAGSRIALFGKGSFDYVKGGGGSGDVTVSYVHNLYDGFQMLLDAVSLYEPLCDFYRNHVNGQYEQGSVPGMTTEPALSAGLLAGASAYTDTAVIVLSRFSERAGTAPASNTTENTIHGRQRPACQKSLERSSRTAIFISQRKNPP